MSEPVQKKDIRLLSIEQLKEVFTSLGEPAFRAKQVFEWLWKHQVKSFNLMTNLSQDLREKLDENFIIHQVKVHKETKSIDGTVKSAFVLHDGHIVEGVLIPSEDRMTACVSSQVGCSLTCKFCATGYMERKRNLHHYEIFDQVELIHQQALVHFNMPLTNIVYMGMGEPLLNYNNMMQSIHMITSEAGMNMSYKRITVSTAGIAKMIRKLAEDHFKPYLALSLHAANDKKRNEIMPINEQNSLEALTEALQFYCTQTNNQVTFEYILFNGFNDDIADAIELAAFCKKIPSKVNIIEYNPISFADFTNTTEDKTEIFAQYLRNKNIIVNVRRSRGKDIDAACGQLAIKNDAL